MNVLIDTLNWIIAHFGETIISILVAYALVLVKRYVGIAMARLDAKLSAEDRYLLDRAVELAVAAVEQFVARPDVQYSSAQKKTQAIHWAQHLLDEWGIKYSAETLAIVVEAKVRELFNGEKEVAPKPVGPTLSPGAAAVQ